MKYRTIRLLILSSIFIYSCSKKDKNQLFHGQILNFITIDTGSVFVFQDSSTNRIDTLVLTHNYLYAFDPVHSQEEDHYIIENRKLYFQRRNKYIDSNYVDYNFEAWGGSNGISASIIITTPDSSFGKTGMRIYEDQFINKNYYTQEVNIANKIHDSLNIKGQTYEAVYENTLRYHDLINPNFCQTYFSLKFGLLKFRLQLDNHLFVKELIYSKIKRP